MTHKSSLKESIFSDMKTALKNKDRVRLSTLRMFIAAIKNKEISKREELEENEVVSIISNYLKKVEESLEMYIKGKRNEMAEQAKKEITIIKEYLPEQLSEEEIAKVIREILNENDFKDQKDLGRAMKAVIPHLKGKADGRVINKKVKELLTNANN